MNARVAVAERLLRQSRPDQPRRLPAREARVERALALLVVAATVAVALAASGARPFDPLAFAACVLAYAAAARVLLYVGGGCALPTQLFLIPMLFALPLDLVPLAVVCAGQLAAAPGRRLTAVGDAGYVFAPVAVLAAAGAPSAEAVSALVIVLACGAQWVLDAALSVGREWLGRGIRPTAQLSVMVRVWTVDALLVPVGLLAVAHADRLIAALIALLGVVVLLGRVTRDRNRRLVEAMDRLEQLERERSRVRVSITRLSRSLGATLDRRTILEAVLGAALDALAAPGGRAVLSGLVHEESSDAARALIRKAETAASAAGAPARIEEGGWVALAHPLRTDHDAGTLTIAAPAGRVSADDDRLLGISPRRPRRRCG